MVQGTPEGWDAGCLDLYSYTLQPEALSLKTLPEPTETHFVAGSYHLQKSRFWWVKVNLSASLVQKTFSP